MRPVPVRAMPRRLGPVPAMLPVPMGMRLAATLLHPVLVHEVDRLGAGLVTLAVVRPILLVQGREIEVDRLALQRQGRALDQQRLREHQCRRGAGLNLDPAVDARLMDADRQVVRRGGAGRANTGSNRSS